MPHRLIKSADEFRGTFLFLAGFMFLPTSVGYILERRPLATIDGLEWMPEGVRLWHLGVVFTVACLTATIIGLFSRRLANRPQLLGYGYAAAMAPPTIAAGIGLIAILHNAPVAVWFSVIAHASLAAAIYLCSEWPNPAPTPPEVP